MKKVDEPSHSPEVKRSAMEPRAVLHNAAHEVTCGKRLQHFPGADKENARNRSCLRNSRSRIVPAVCEVVNYNEFIVRKT